MSKKKKVILAILITLIVMAGIVAAIFVLKKKNQDKKVAAVYAVSELGYDASMYGYESTLSGNVTVNMEQKVYVSSSQKVEEICVKEGDTVKAGDVLIVYDTTAQNLQLEIERTELELARVAVVSAEQELEKLKNTTPVEPTTEEPTTEEPTTEEPTTEELTTEELTTEEPTTEEPTTEEPTTEEPTTEEPTTEVTTTEIPVTEDPITKVPTEKYAVNEPSVEDVPEDGELPDEESGEVTYTKEELEKAITEKQNELNQLRIDYQLKQISYEIMEYQNSTGEVFCNFDGVVKSVIDEDTAATENEPIVVIGGNEGYTVKSSIGELSLMSVKAGDTCSLYCYDTGMTYEGIITEISDLPTEDGYNYSAKSESFYPMTIAITDADDLQQGMYMEITLNQSEEENSDAIYLPMAFVIKENSRYYVMKEVDGVLKKEYVSTGKTLYGDSIEIKSGVTYDDYIAFPYLDEAQEGVKTEQKSTMELYY